MTTDRTPIVTPNASTDNARNLPASLPRRQRVASAIASVAISGVLLGAVVFGMLDSSDAPVVTAGTGATSTLA